MLRARLAALIARSNVACDRDRLTVGSLQIDRARQEASVASRPMVLSVTTFELPYRLALEPERVHTQAQLLRDVWGYPAGVVLRTRTVGAHAVRLRRKLVDAGAARPIENRRGRGYTLGPLHPTPDLAA